MTTNSSAIAEAVLRAIIVKAVSDALGKVGNSIVDIEAVKHSLTSEGDLREARLMVLNMMQEGCAEFCAKMSARIEKSK
jgi:hypothetical protein